MRVGNRLVVGGAEGVSVVDLDASGLGAPRRFPLDGGAVVGLERRPRSDGGTVLATLDDGSARMLDVTPNGDVETRARYPNPPWFAGSARLGNVLVRVAGDGQSAPGQPVRRVALGRCRSRQ